MKNRKLLTVAGTMILTMALFAGCGQSVSQDMDTSGAADVQKAEVVSELSGEITMAGETRKRFTAPLEARNVNKSIWHYSHCPKNSMTTPVFGYWNPPVNWQR